MSPEDREKAIQIVEEELRAALHRVGITQATVPAVAYVIVVALAALSPAEPVQAPDPVRAAADALVATWEDRTNTSLRAAPALGPLCDAIAALSAALGDD